MEFAKCKEHLETFIDKRARSLFGQMDIRVIDNFNTNQIIFTYNYPNKLNVEFNFYFDITSRFLTKWSFRFEYQLSCFKSSEYSLIYGQTYWKNYDKVKDTILIDVGTLTDSNTRYLSYGETKYLRTISSDGISIDVYAGIVCFWHALMQFNDDTHFLSSLLGVTIKRDLQKPHCYILKDIEKQIAVYSFIKKFNQGF